VHLSLQHMLRTMSLLYMLFVPCTVSSAPTRILLRLLWAMQIYLSESFNWAAEILSHRPSSVHQFRYTVYIDSGRFRGGGGESWVHSTNLHHISLAKLVGLVWGLAATRRSVCIHQINRVNSRNDYVMMTAP